MNKTWTSLRTSGPARLPPDPFRLCIDLNVWVRCYLAHAGNLRGTASQFIIEAVQDGRSGVGPIQLVVSHAMLDRLHGVLLRKGASLDSSTQFISLIASISRLGPSGSFPHLVLGGGVNPTGDARMPVYDPYDLKAIAPRFDPEDGRVIDVAVAGRAHALVTSNFRDFADRHDRVISPGRVHVRHTAALDVFIAQPAEMAAWLRTGTAPAVRR